jgi:hypothetical protein
MLDPPPVTSSRIQAWVSLQFAVETDGVCVSSILVDRRSCDLSLYRSASLSVSGVQKF